MKTKKVLPKHTTAEFVPPADLTEEEAAVWREISEIARSSRTTKVSDADKELLRQFCQLSVLRNYAWAEYIKKPERILKIAVGLSQDKVTPKIVLKENEYYLTWNECNKALVQLLRELELTPKHRYVSRHMAAQASAERPVVR